MNPLKPYFYGAIAIAFVLLLGYAGWLYHDRSTYIAEVSSERKLKAEAIEKLDKLKTDIQNEAKNRESYLSQLDQADNERNRLEKCIADKSCVPTIRVRVPAVCPTSTQGDTGGAVTASAELDPDSGRTYTRLREGIQQLEAKYAFCQKTLVDWSK